MVKILKYILKQIARLTIRRFKPRVIAITGSVGKTSAKEAIFAALKNHKRIRKSGGNLNNELGASLTIIGDRSEKELKLVSRDTPPGKYKIKKFLFWLKVIVSALISFIYQRKSAYPQMLILEYGADRPGDIKHLLEIAKPEIAVVTMIGEMPVHLEFYESAQAVAKEKLRLVENLFTSNFAVLNCDDESVLAMKEKTRAKVMTFGFDKKSDIKINNFENKFENGLIGVSFKIEYDGSFVPVVLRGVLGKSHAYAAAAATAAGIICGLNLVEAAESLAMNYKPARGRMNLIRGIKNAYIIDDSYNAAPASMKQALETLRDLKVIRKVAVLGDMLELGEMSEEAHKSIGKLSVEAVDFLITVGERGKIIASAARDAGLAQENILSFNKAEEAIESVKKIVRSKDVILIKASRNIGLDKIAESLKI